MDAIRASSEDDPPHELKRSFIRDTQSGCTNKLEPGYFSDSLAILSRQSRCRNSLRNERSQHQHHDPLLPTANAPLCSAISPSADSDRTWIVDTTPTKSLRKGLKAHRRVATIPTVFLSDSDATIHSDIGSYRPIKSEFGVKVKVLDRVDFESDSYKSLPSSLRSMRDNFRKAICRRLVKA